MSKKSKKVEEKKDDFLAQQAAADAENAEAYTLDIPEDEIWTYQIEGLQAPHINQPFKNAGIKKAVVVILLVVAILTAIFLSVRAVHKDLYTYQDLGDGTYMLDRFANPGDIRDVTIDYYVDIKTGEKDLTKPIVKIDEYAFNCDETIHTLRIGKDVKEISSRAIYSCWWIQNVFVDEENPYYCDVDGVLYTKDMTEIVFYPNDHDKALRLAQGYNVPTITVDAKGNPKNAADVKDGTTIDDYLKVDENGFPLANQEAMIKENTLFEDNGRIMEELWGTTPIYNEAYFQQYNRNVRTYVIPSTVTKIGELAFAYSNIVDLYIPEGVTEMGNMAIFKNTVLINLYSYKSDEPITDTTYNAIDQMTEIYASLPEGLESIGTDCMYYLRGLNYMYIPSTVKSIGHHALWDAVYKEGDELRGVSYIDVAADEETFKNNCETGQQWRPQYDYMLFKKSVDLNYSAERQSQLAYNVNRQYYWAVQWIINNQPDENKAQSAYLVKDFDGNGIPELVLREYNTEANTTTDTVLTFKYGYLYDFDGEAEFTDAEFSELTDNAQLDSIWETVK